MILRIEGEQPFQWRTSSYAVSPSNEEYVLCYSADGKAYTSWTEPTPANEVLVVNAVPDGMYFKMVGNKSVLTIQG
jgi:hypothetical protein